MSSQIPLGKIDEGIKKSIENATSYFEDALFLYKNKRYQSSFFCPCYLMKSSEKHCY